MRTIFLIGILLFVSSVTLAQEEEDAAAPADGAADDTAAENSEAEECKEAWEYLDFLKDNVKEKLEKILQETLFEPSKLLDMTVSEAMTQTLEIRDAILERIKSVRGVAEDSIESCDPNVKQDEFLSTLRMEIMTVLLSLIEPGAATPEKLQDIGRQMLQVRTKVNTEITRIIMLRETGNITPRVDTGDCNCGILPQIVEGLDNVVGDKEESAEDGDAVVVEAGTEDEEAAPTAEAAEAPEAAETPADSEGGEMTPIAGLTMTLMEVDQRISVLYETILAEMDEDNRKTASDELTNLKDINTQMNDVINKILEQGENTEKIEKIVKRDVASLRNNVERQLNECQKRCPSECKSCGSDKIKEIKDKLESFKLTIQDLEEDEAKETVRNELMAMLKTANTDMTDLLKKKAELEVGQELDKCDTEKLDVLESVKGPMWMMVNITIFSTKDILNEMIIAVEVALNDKQSGFCGKEVIIRTPTDEEDTCDYDELNKAAEFITDIDNIISKNLFKGTDEEERKDAMLLIIDLKSSMDERVRDRYTKDTICHEEVNQIKTVYVDQLTKCLVEMMNPRISFTTKSRAERVACVKQLRVTIEDRRGELLMREIEKRIKQQETDEEVVEADAS